VVARLGLVVGLCLLFVAAALALAPRLGPVAAQPALAAEPPAALGEAHAAAVSWGVPISLITSGGFWDVAVGDINEDGRLDAVAVYSASNGIKAWLGSGSGGWTASSTGLPTTGAYRGVELADVDQDYHLDIVVAGTGVRIWHGDGSGGWSSATGPATSGSYSDVAVGDWNNDGRPDIVATRRPAEGDPAAQACTMNSVDPAWVSCVTALTDRAAKRLYPVVRVG
jgi:hypothetical protein